MALGQVRTLSLSCVEVDALGAVAVDKEILEGWTMRLENLFLRGTSPATIKVIATALARAKEPTLKRLALTPTFEAGFADAASELITRSGEELETFEWLPSIHFCEYFLLVLRLTLCHSLSFSYHDSSLLHFFLLIGLFIYYPLFHGRCLLLLRTNANLAFVQLPHPARSTSRHSNSCAPYVSRSASANRTRTAHSPRSSACSRRSPTGHPAQPCHAHRG